MNCWFVMREKEGKKNLSYEHKIPTAGVEISIQDIDTAHRIPTRNATSSLRPVVCKFTRRIAKENVMNVRKDAYKVTASSIGLPADCTLENVKLFDHLILQLKGLASDLQRD